MLFYRVLFLVLVLSVVFNLVARILEDRRRRQADEAHALEQLALHGDIVRVLGLLRIVAERWGDPPADVRRALEEALRQ